MEIAFTYHHIGAEYDVLATFIPSKFKASMDGPYDGDPILDELEITGPDGYDCTGEMGDNFTRKKGTANPLEIKMVSIFDLIEEEAFSRYLNNGE